MTNNDDVWIPSACGQCYSFCGIVAHRVDGKIVKIEGNPQSSNVRGRLCPKGVSGPMLLYDPNRVGVPLKRTNPRKGIDVDPAWTEITWEEALDTVSQKLEKIRQEDPRKLFVTMTVNAPHEGRFARLFGTAFGSPNASWSSGGGNHCGNAEHLFAGLNHGAWAKQPDMDYCNYVLNFGVPCGTGAYYAATATAQRLADARARGMRHVVIDPFLSPTAEKADEWIPIRPGTDAAFGLAMVHVLIHELGLYDREYLKHHTNAPYLIGDDGYYVREAVSDKPLIWDPLDNKAKAFDAEDIKDFALEGCYEAGGTQGRTAFSLLKEHVVPFTPEWAAPITTVPVDTIRRIAREFVEAARIGSTIVIDGHELPFRPAAVLYFRGVQAHKNGTLNSMALELLIELVGASNVPGGLLGKDARSLGYPGTGRPAWEPTAGPDGLLVVGKFAGSRPYPPAPVSKPESIALNELVPTAVASPASFPLVLSDPEKFGLDYRGEMHFHLGTNFLMTSSDPQAVAAAFSNVFQVSFSLFLDESTYLSDIILPDACYLERYSVAIDDSGQTNPAVGEWCYHLRQPVTEPLAQRRNSPDVMLELADRIGMREEYYALIGLSLGLKGSYALDPAKKYSVREIADLHFRYTYGEEHGLEYFEKHGVLRWPKLVEEVYWKAFVKVRVPIYFEWFPKVGEQVKKVAEEAGFGDVMDTSAFKPLPEWRPCLSHEEKRSDYDLFAIYYRVPLHCFGATYNNPWLDEASEIDPYVYRVAINAQTARRKGIQDGDWMEITSAGNGNSVKTRARVTEGIHPEVIAIANLGGRWSKFLPVASQPHKGACFETLMPLTFDNMDVPSQNWDLCVKVKVTKAGR